MSGAFSVTGRLRRLVVVLAVLMILICATSVAVLVNTRENFERLSTSIVPAHDANAAILQAATDAETGLRGYAATGRRALLQPYRGAQAQADQSLATLDRELSDDHGLADLVARERQATQAWWRYTRRGIDRLDRGQTVDLVEGSRLFDQVRSANVAMEDRLTAERRHARDRAYAGVAWGVAIVVAVTLLSLALTLYRGRRVSRSLTRPLTHLRETVERQREGDLSARADETEGALDVRSLARDFNALSAQNEQLMSRQDDALGMHQLTIDVARAVRQADSVPAALDQLCRLLGEGMGVDRVMANTIDGAREVVLGAQWHADGLAPLPDIPQDLMPHIGLLADELWRSASRLALPDFLAPEVQTQERSRIFHRETGARAVILVPIGLGEQVIGVLFVLAVHAPRRWRREEANAVQQCATFMGQVIVEAEYRAHQEEHVARLQQLDRQKTDFMGTVSHELRTPLTSIGGYLELLRDGDMGEVSATQDRALAVIERNTARLRGLIEDLLVLNRIESSGLSSGAGPVEVDAALHHVVESLQPIAATGGVDLRLDLAAGPFVVQADAVQLERALTNVVGNAVKFTPAGGSVCVKVWSEDGRVHVRCTDTGIGIPADEMDALGTRFFRASNAAARTIPGTGLGLAIVRSIVEGFGGEVALTSSEGVGTTVLVDLPATSAGLPGD